MLQFPFLNMSDKYNSDNNFTNYSKKQLIIFSPLTSLMRAYLDCATVLVTQQIENNLIYHGIFTNSVYDKVNKSAIMIGQLLRVRIKFIMKIPFTLYGKNSVLFFYYNNGIIPGLLMYHAKFRLNCVINS